MDEQIDKRIQGYWILGNCKTNKKLYYYNYYHSSKPQRKTPLITVKFYNRDIYLAKPLLRLLRYRTLQQHTRSIQCKSASLLDVRLNWPTRDQYETYQESMYVALVISITVLDSGFPSEDSGFLERCNDQHEMSSVHEAGSLE